MAEVTFPTGIITDFNYQTMIYIFFRDSKLTRLLQDSLGGNAKTIMIANIGPANYNYDETSTTLRYANRAKNIKNIPKINEDPKDALLREFQDEISKLKKKLAERGGSIDTDSALTGEEMIAEAKQKIKADKEMAEAEKSRLMKEARKKSEGLLHVFVMIHADDTFLI